MAEVVRHRPSHPYNAGTEHFLFLTDQADIACTNREAPVRCRASRMKGKLHPTKNRS